MPSSLRDLPPGLRAFSYARASRDPSGRGTSTRDQHIENGHVIERLQATLAGKFTDDDRGASRYAKRARDEYEDMVRLARAGECDILVAWESSRWHRDLAVYVTLRDLCAELGILWCYNGRVYDMNDDDDRFSSGLDALTNERDAGKIRARVLRTTRLQAQRGAPHGRIPYGYRREYDPKTGELLRQVPHEDQAPIVREVARRVLAGEGMRGIAHDLNTRGIEPPAKPTGTMAEPGWTGVAIRGLLLRWSSIAKRPYGGEVLDCQWEPILDEATFYAVQRMLTDPTRLTKRDSSVKHILSGAAKAECGAWLRIMPNRGYLSYVCIRPQCHCVALAKARFEAYITEVLLARLSDPKVAARLRQNVRGERQRELMAQIERDEAELSQARELARDRRLSVVSLAGLEASLLPAIESAREELGRLSTPHALLGLIGPNARAVWEDMTPPEQRNAIRSAMTITLHKASAYGIRRIEPGRITYEWLI